MKLDGRTRAKPKRKPGMRPDWKAGAAPGGPPQKPAPSSQRKPPARPRAAAAAIAVAAAEEERRLRQRNRLTLEEDKPAVERCLEELVFGDVENDEDALLRRLRDPKKDVPSEQTKHKSYPIFGADAASLR
ncbi:U3 small nucleolar RNA-associated protein 18 homolog isoform X3 [Hylobates moloch]|nr:U3 small nucleolar RNA-associated protein 18 homolog isoform X3 [Hylobates moloch]